MSKSLFGRPRAEVEAALPDREPVVCPLCRCEPSPFAVDFQGFHLARCPSCGLECQNPRPVLAQLSEAVYGATYHPTAHAGDDPYRERTFARQLARIGRHVAARPASVLDVGCGAGAFLRYARGQGWDASGADIHLTDAARGTGASLYEGALTAIDFGGATFDAVRFNQVLEHTPDPLAELRAARRLTRPDGLLVVGVPNLAGWNIRLKSAQSRLGLKRRPWKHYGALHHLWFFTPATLARLAEAAGFEVVDWETPADGRPEAPGVLRDLVARPVAALRAGGILDLYAAPC
ncbi:MAG: class I SAM-dependent methyltransferase [Acidobacteria bacterium]|nr:class I SAM-dependent methyltransferase [Acidobacteriota bacterium]MYD70042.1 class I SAM-dependent methyltransferase [Acidobacteriota bacterium]MYJ05542.1 class I SAM-dependent methyltransferase [Acidobacteriota bacterium]